MEKFFQLETKRIKGEIDRFELMIQTRVAKQENLKGELEIQDKGNWQTTLITREKISILDQQIQLLGETLSIYQKEHQKYEKLLQNKDSLVKTKDETDGRDK